MRYSPTSQYASEHNTEPSLTNSPRNQPEMAQIMPHTPQQHAVEHLGRSSAENNFPIPAEYGYSTPRDQASLTPREHASTTPRAHNQNVNPPPRTSSARTSSRSTRGESASSVTPTRPRQSSSRDHSTTNQTQSHQSPSLAIPYHDYESTPNSNTAHGHPPRDSSRQVSTKEVGDVMKRVVISDPETDAVRANQRMEEAAGKVPNEYAEVQPASSSKRRQDFSASNSKQKKEVKFGEYILGQTLGEGEFGKVKLGWKKDGSAEVAIKLIRRETLTGNPSRLPKIYREVNILMGLKHPNIVKLHEMLETDRFIGIVLEYASGGELFDYILHHRYLTDNSAKKLFAQLISGVGYLHKVGIVHRDLKLENLLLDRHKNIIITDFGFANTFDPNDELTSDIEANITNKDFVKRFELDKLNPQTGWRRGDLMATSCGSPCYAAPELVVTDGLYTGRKVDVWSCGVILVCLSVKLFIFPNAC
jgi:protein-serine/threonine kinase